MKIEISFDSVLNALLNRPKAVKGRHTTFLFAPPSAMGNQPIPADKTKGK